MTTQSIMSQQSKLLASSTGNVTPSKKQGDSGFDLFINTSMKSSKNDNNKDLSTIKNSSAKAGSKDNDANDTNKISKADNPFAKVKNFKDAGKPEDKLSSNSNSKKDNQKDLIDDVQQMIGQVVGMLQAIEQAAMKALNLSPEELNQLLGDQNMTMTDLLNSEKLQQLVLAGNGSNDILSALTDEGLADTMKQLLEDVNQIKEDANLKLSLEQINKLVDQASKGDSQVTDLTQNDEMANQLNLSEKKPTSTEEVTQTVNTDSEKSASTVGEDKQVTSQGQKTFMEERDSSNQSSNQKSKNDYGAKDPYQVFVDNLVQSTQSTQNGFSTDVNQVTQLREIVNQIVDRIKVSVSTELTTMDLQLNPENLGRVNLNVQSKNGVMTANFVVQNEVTKQAIESQMQTLRDTLSQQGVKVEAIEVTVSANAFEQNYNQESGSQAQPQKGTSGKKITLEDAIRLSEIVQDTIENEDITGISGSQINYKA